MLIKSEKLKDLDVISMRTGQSVARVTRPITSPFDLTVVGFYTTNSAADILLVQNVRELNRTQAIIDDVDDFSTKEELPRLKEVLRLDYELIGKRVVTESRKKLGKVNSYVIDNLSFEVQKIHVHQPVWRSLSGGVLIIDRKQIIEVSENIIIVTDASLKSGALATQQAAS